MTEFISFLAPQISTFIRYRQASDHWNEASYEVNLKLFDRYCYGYSDDVNSELTQEMVDGWCRKRDNEENNSCRSRIYVVVSFIRFLRDRNLTSVTPPEIPRKERRTYIPHSFTNEELAAFFAACDRISARKNVLQDACRKLRCRSFSDCYTAAGSEQTRPGFWNGKTWIWYTVLLIYAIPKGMTSITLSYMIQCSH